MDTEQVLYYPAETRRTVPFSAAIRVGKMLYLSEQIGIDPAGNLVAGGIAAEPAKRWRISA